MTDHSDIREWARGKGLEVGDRGRLPKDIVTDYYAENGITPPESNDTEPDTSPLMVGELVDSGAPQTKGETAPKKPAKVRRPRSLRRASFERFGSGLWGFASQFVGGGAFPVGRVMQLQAPVAGLVLDDMVKGTVIDRIAQPLLRASEKGEAAFALVGPPLIVGLMTKYPQLQAMLLPALKESIVAWYEIAGPKMEEQRKRRERAVKNMGLEGVDIDGLIEMIFAAPEEMPQPV